MRVLNDNVLVKFIEDKGPKTTAGGLFLAESATKNDPIAKGEVVGTGPGSMLQDGTRAPIDVKVGEFVYFAKFKALQVMEGTETFYVVGESAILAVQ